MVAVNGRVPFKCDYFRSKDKSWHQRQELFSQIAELLPQAAYLFYINEFKDKFGNFYEQCQMLNIICNQKKKL